MSISNLADNKNPVAQIHADNFRYENTDCTIASLANMSGGVVETAILQKSGNCYSFRVKVSGLTITSASTVGTQLFLDLPEISGIVLEQANIGIGTWTTASSLWEFTPVTWQNATGRPYVNFTSGAGDAGAAATISMQFDVWASPPS